MPLRFPRLVMAAAVIGLAVAWTALGSVPAQADQVRHQEWWLAKLHVTRAWHTTMGSGVTVALLDTGVNPRQADLSGSVITGQDFTNSKEKLSRQFFGVHGTAMASLIVGHGHGPGNASGVLGVAPDARLLSVRVTLDGGDPMLSNAAIASGLPGAIATGIRYAVSNGAQVIDLPLDPGQTPSDLLAPAPTPTPSTSPSPAAPPPPDGTAAEQSAVAFALSQGVVLVAPGGDNGAGTDAANFPAAYPGVISVGAFDSNLIKTVYSSHQSYVTLTAAGDSMVAAVPPNGYATVSTTAAASAVVTGIVALIKSQYPELTPAQVTEALIRGTAIRPSGGTTDGSGHGTADAARALAAAARIAAPGPQRAGAGAVSRQLPGAPSASPLAGESLRPKLERDALISLAVLVILLLPITVYGLMQRRRRRARALARAEQERAARAPYAHNGDGAADMMRDYFATLPAQAGGYGGARSAGASRGRAGTGGDAGTRAAGTLADSRFAAADDAARRTGGQLPRSPLTPITRVSTPRAPKVSGSPPWDPAPKPEGEVPWANAPAPTVQGRRGAAHAAPPTSSIWAAATPGTPAHEAGDDSAGHHEAGHHEARHHEAGHHEAGHHEAGDDSVGDDSAESGPGGRPIYVWNPGATTDTFPQVPRDGGS